MSLSLRIKKQSSISKEQKFTSDFNSVIFIVLWNSLGFFFIEFIMNYLIYIVLGYPAYNVGLFFSFITLGGLVSSSFIGYLTDRFSKRILVMLGSFGRGISYFGLYISILFQSLIGMYISAFLLGLGANAFWNPLDAIISEKSSKYHRSSAFGKRRFALGMGMVLGTVVGFSIFTIANIFTPDNSLIVYGAIPLFGISNFYAGIQFLRRVDESKKFEYPVDQNDVVNQATSDALSNVSKKNFSIIYFIGIIVLFSGFFSASINSGIYRPFIQTYALTNIEKNAEIVAWFYLPTSLLGSLIAPKLGTLADKLNTYKTIAIASLIGGFVTWLIINSANLWIFAILLIIDNTIMLTVSFVFINFLSRLSVKHRGKIFAAIALFESVGMIIGPFLGGVVWETISPQTPFIISIIVEWSLIPLFIIGMKLLSPYLVESKEDKSKSWSQV
jgi:DHA1 family multidrug resistance protein-like MFS transporter